MVTGDLPDGSLARPEPTPAPDDLERRARAFLAHRTVALEADGHRFGEGDDGVPGLSDASAEGEARAIRAALQWQRTLFDHGFTAVTDPTVPGRVGLGPEELVQFRRIQAEFDVPDTSSLLVGLDIVAPVIAAHGTPAQADVLGGLLRGELLACQLFSEPGKGSDLGAVTTKAARDGDEWRIDGQKGWGSYAQFSDVGLLLTRTDPEASKEQGLTMFLIDMHQPGIDVRPMRHMTGGAHFSDVFLTGARVPDSRRLGAAGDGWRVAKTALSNERSASGAGHDTPSGLLIRRLGHLREHTDRAPAAMAVDREAVAGAAVLGRVLEATNQRLRPPSPGRPGLESSITKLLRNRFLTAAVDAGCAIAGPAAAADDGRWGRYAWGRARVALPGLRLAGGSDEIQRNILAERVLGLPREPRPSPGAEPAPDAAGPPRP